MMTFFLRIFCICSPSSVLLPPFTGPFPPSKKDFLLSYHVYMGIYLNPFPYERRVIVYLPPLPPHISQLQRSCPQENVTQSFYSRDQVASLRFANQEVAHSNIHSDVSVEAIMHVHMCVHVQACNYICMGVRMYMCVHCICVWMSTHKCSLNENSSISGLGLKRLPSLAVPLLLVLC